MRKPSPQQAVIPVSLLALICSLCFLGRVTAQTTYETIPAGSYIVNMGVTPQSDANGLKPYGMIYDLLKNYQVPVKWAINPSKGRDGVDFTYNGVSYRGGPFIILASYRTATVNSVITTWANQGVVGVTTTSAIANVPIYGTIKAAPRWAVNPDKYQDVTKKYFELSGIPASSHVVKEAPSLNSCDDIFLIPHDEAISAGNLATWNQTYKGYIWIGCRSGSVAENGIYNFLTVNGVTGEGGSWGSPSVSYDYNGEPPMQFMGNTAHQQAQANGANRSYTPYSAWRSTTRKAVYITGQQRAAIAFGPAGGNNNFGWVMMSGGHSYVDIKNSNIPNRVALIRGMFNFSFMSVIKKSVNVTLNIPDTISSGTGTVFTYSLSPAGGSYTTQWSSSCGGTFSPNATSTTVTYTPPANTTSCVITVKVTDGCGRVAFNSKQVKIGCTLTATPTVTNVSCNGGANGSISIAVSGGAGPYSWNWSRVSPAGTAIGAASSSPVLLSGLSAGTYNVTVSSASGCSKTFSSLVAQPNALSLSTAVTNYNCLPDKGAITLTVSGGTPGYTYDWSNDGPENPDNDTKDLSNLLAGTYTVTVTDTKGCTKTTSATVTGPTAVLAISLVSQTNVSCSGGNNGAIDISVAGGTSPYTYKWSTGQITQDRTTLVANTYTVTVTDNKACTTTASYTITQPTVLTLSLAVTHPTCPPGGTPPLNSDGSITTTVSGGTSPYTYNWADLTPPPVEPANRTNLPVGTYTVTVTDNKGCTKTASVTLDNTTEIPIPPPAIGNN